MNQKIWLSSPHMGGTELSYIREAFEDNWIAPLGPHVNAFEAQLASVLGQDRKVAALSSGTAALHLALIACGVGPGDEVICQSMTFSASANPIVYQQAVPVFVDSEPVTWNICPRALRTAIEDRIARRGVKGKPKAIIAVHLYGMPFLVDEIQQIANEFGIPLIEDAAEALGSTYRGRACGTFGRFGVLSFNGNKIITTSGGGALVCGTAEDKAQAVFLATQARDAAPHYQHSQIGYNYRMSNVCAGIGRGQVEVLGERVRARRAMNVFYQTLFAGVEGVEVFREPRGVVGETRDVLGTGDSGADAHHSRFFSNHWLSAILLDSAQTGVTREQLRQAFLEDNIESRPLWKPMHLQPVFAEAPYYGDRVAEDLFDRGLCLPSGSNLSDDDRNRIATVVKAVFG